MDWKLNEAQESLGKVMNKALLEGPQKIIWQGDSVIVLSEQDYQKLIGEKKTLKEHLMQGPDFEGLDLQR
jgi:hypothetical protein